MVRALFSVVMVVLLSAIAFLLYANYVRQEQSAPPEITKGTPPAAPRPAVPQPIVQPPAPPAPVPEVRPKETRVATPAPAPVPETEPRRTYTVVSGDSLWSISKKNFGTPEHARKIAEMNKLGPKDRIKPGQVLYIPDLPMAAPVEGSEASKTEDDPDQWANRNQGEDSEIMPPTLSTKAEASGDK
jgi:LysM repeat protein